MLVSAFNGRRGASFFIPILFFEFPYSFVLISRSYRADMVAALVVCSCVSSFLRFAFDISSGIFESHDST